MGLAGLGDLVLTATSDLSRNRRVGLALAKGIKLEEALGGLGHVAEGVYTAREVDRRAAELRIEMPITRVVRRVLDGPQGVRVTLDGKPYLSFYSNDYLGQANHPALTTKKLPGVSG
jgi:glycerol-3-phosphate dehydrogenase